MNAGVEVVGEAGVSLVGAGLTGVPVVGGTVLLTGVEGAEYVVAGVVWTG